MRLRQEITVGAGILLLLQLLTAFAAIGLLARVSTATDQILRENVYSMEAVEDMLAVLASSSPDAARFEDALVRAESNITVAEERPLLARVRASRDASFRGEPNAREAMIRDLRDLSSVNRGSMRSADADARFLGVSGAWAAVLLGFSAFGVGVGVYRRLRDRVEAPILELDLALEAAREGDEHRRCGVLDAPDELTRLRDNLNWMLDQLNAAPPQAVSALRRPLLAVLDQIPVPTLLVHEDGQVVASNQAALDAAAAGQIRTDTLSAVLPPGWTGAPIAGGSMRLIQRRSASEE